MSLELALGWLFFFGRLIQQSVAFIIHQKNPQSFVALPTKYMQQHQTNVHCMNDSRATIGGVILCATPLPRTLQFIYEIQQRMAVEEDGGVLDRRCREIPALMRPLHSRVEYWQRVCFRVEHILIKWKHLHTNSRH